MVNTGTETSEGRIRRRNGETPGARVLPFVAGGLVFLIILAAYFSAIFVGRALARPEKHPVFRTLTVGKAKAYGTASRMKDIYSQWTIADSSGWTNYEYTGRMMLTDDRGGIGVTFLGGHRGKKPPFYNLMRCGEGDTWFLSGRGSGTLAGKSSDTEVSPEAGVWYRFKVEVDDDKGRTEIRAKIWPDGDPEPEEWQVDCFDAGRARNAEGSVGVWASCEGKKYFDDLLVTALWEERKEGRQGAAPARDSSSNDIARSEAQPLAFEKSQTSRPLLREDFERFPVGTHPANWKDGRVPIDLSEATDTLTRFFGTNLVDFSGPWDEAADLTVTALAFSLAGLVSGALLRRKRTLRLAGEVKRWRTPFELLPFVALFAYAGAREGAAVILYLAGGVCAGYVWKGVHAIFLKVLPVQGRQVLPEPGA